MRPHPRRPPARCIEARGAHNRPHDDAQMAAVLTYIRNAWGNQVPAVKAGVVVESRRAFSEQVHPIG